jgi:hypothetical protein
VGAAGVDGSGATSLAAVAPLALSEEVVLALKAVLEAVLVLAVVVVLVLVVGVGAGVFPSVVIVPLSQSSLSILLEAPHLPP